MLTPFGKEIRRLRNEKGWKLLDLADRLKLSTAFVSGVETGRKTIPDGYVSSTIRAMELTAEEARSLRHAADRTRKDVRVDHLSEEQRELVAAFARRLDGAPDDLVARLKKAITLKSISGETPFHRKRRGLIVPPLSAAVIREFAERVRSVFVEDDQVGFPIIRVLESQLDRAFPNFHLDVVEREIMGEDEGRVMAGLGTLALREDVYIAACRGNGRARFTACHEFAHFLLHREVVMARSWNDGMEIYRDSEWQADTYAGALMMSKRHLSKFANSLEAARLCGMSSAAAQHQWSIYAKEGLVPKSI
jgi:transcriptional regulator with XRE-family HTH domain